MLRLGAEWKRQVEFSLLPEPFPSGLSHSSTEEAKLTEHSHGLGCASGNPTLPLLLAKLFCGREQIIACGLSFISLQCFHVSSSGDAKAGKPAKKGKRNKGPAESDFENGEGATLDAFQPCPAQQAGHRLSWNKLKQGTHPNYTADE